MSVRLRHNCSREYWINSSPQSHVHNHKSDKKERKFNSKRSSQKFKFRNSEVQVRNSVRINHKTCYCYLNAPYTFWESLSEKVHAMYGYEHGNSNSTSERSTQIKHIITSTLAFKPFRERKGTTVSTHQQRVQTNTNCKERKDCKVQKARINWSRQTLIRGNFHRSITLFTARLLSFLRKSFRESTCNVR